jgi:cell division protease FtsH
VTLTPVKEFESRPRESERLTRRPLSWWDRIKFLVLLVALFGFFVSAELGDNPLLPFGEAFDLTLEGKWWIVALFGVEVVRQIHYFICERSERYYRLWKDRIFGLGNRRLARMSAYTRYRVARSIKWAIFLAVVLLVVARLLDTTIFRAPFELISWISDRAPEYANVFVYLGVFVGFQVFLWGYLLTRGGVEAFFPDDIETRFSDVWGQDQVLRKVQENIAFLEDPELIESKGGYVPGGLLLWGPPGTGKTLMAESIAGETGKPFVNIDASMLNVGIGVLKVKFLFRRLRRYALRYGGVVAFFDEADSLGNRGTLAGTQGGPGGFRSASPFTAARTCCGLSYVSDAGRSMLLAGEAGADVVEEGRRRNRFFMMGGMGGGGGLLQVMLSEMSGLKKPRGVINRFVRRALGMKPKPPPRYRMLLIMATNMPEALDPAMLRPGRIDRIYKVGYPSKLGRIRTYKGYFDKVPNELTDEDIDRLATVTPYATGATIKDLVNESLISAILAGRESVTWADVVKAKHLKDLGPPEDVEYIERERHATALHEACHAVVAYRVRQHLVIDLATIEKGGNYLGMVSSIPPDDIFTHWRSDFEADVMVSLASLAGEKRFFEGDSSSGVTGDLETATQLATLMEGYWGMGSTITSHAVTDRLGIGKPGPGEDKEQRGLLKGSLATRIEAKLRELFERTEALIDDNRHAILAVTHALETHKTLTGDDVEAVIEGRRGLLVDGRPYHTSDFAEIAERYHNAVVDAHTRHSTVGVVLPVLPPVLDDELEALPLVAGAANGDAGHADTDDDDPPPHPMRAL